jgi:dipeptidyl aminopeptidase/acylaminoacyl peptidase/dipeptidase
MKRSLFAPCAILVLIALCFLSAPSTACTALIAGSGTTADGSLLFAKTEDDTRDDIDFLWRIPRRQHEAGSVVRLKRGGIVPQVSQTWALLWDQVPGTDYSSTVVNEWGVALGSNACPSREDPPEVVAARGDLVDGGIGFDLRLIVGERARTAREAVEIATGLLDRFGYAASGRSLNIAGPDGAWQLQMVCGKQYLARRVQDDEVAVLANTYSIRDVDPDDHENFVCSPRLIEYAIERGWYDPASGPFDFAAAYASPESHSDPRNTDRQWNLARLLDADFPLTWQDARQGRMPVAVHPDRRLTPADIMAIFRNHFAGTALDSTQVLGVGPHDSPVRAACWATTHRMTIVQERSELPPEIGTVIWRALEAPCASGFVPWYLATTDIPAPFQMAPLRADTARAQRSDFQFSMPAATWRLGLDSSGELFKLQVDLVDGDYAAAAPLARRTWDDFEAGALQMQAAVEDTALQLYRRDPDEARRYLAAYTGKLANRSLAVARNLIATLPRTPGTLTARGRYFLGEGDPKTALASFAEALQLDPCHEAARRGLEQAQRLLGPAPMRPEDMSHFRTISDPRISPDGRQVAFVVTETHRDTDASDSDIWLLDLAAGGSVEPRQLTHGPGDDTSPRWSPDGHTLAFLSDREGQRGGDASGPEADTEATTDLYLIDTNGGEAVRLTSAPASLRDPLWSNNGTFLVAGARVVPAGLPPQQRENWTAEELPDCQARTIDHLMFRQSKRWLGDRRNHLFRIDAATGELTDLTPGLGDTPPVSLQSRQDYDLAPDSDELCFVLNEEMETALSTNHDLFVRHLASGEIARATDNPALDQAPRYSPDGRWLAWLAMSRPGYEADRRVLVVRDRSSGELRRLTERLDRVVRDPRWSPDSRRLYFTARDEGRVALYTVSLAGKVERLLAEGAVSDLAVAPDGRRLVFVRSRAHEPPELWTLALKDGGARAGRLARLTAFNDSVAAAIELPPLEDFEFAGAGGTTVHGFLMRPPGFAPQRRYPVVLAIHGGPQGMWTDSFMTSWFAYPLVTAPGYVGVFINPRGSSGYGQEFQDQVSRDYGGRCQEDLLRGLDHAIATYAFIDADRQAAIGGSFGGYMVDWLLGGTDRFRCAVSHAGLFNLTSFFGATEELWFPAWDMGDSPWDQPDLYERWSPYRRAKSFQTPTLVTHGLRDYRVPFAESQQLFTALQTQGIDSRLVVFPDEGHVLAGPQNNVRWWREIQRWLAKYLGECAGRD